MTHRTVVTQHKVHIVRWILKAALEIRDQGLKKQLHVGSMREFNKTLREDPRAGDRETNNWDLQQVVENEELDIVERLAPSEMEEVIAAFSVRRVTNVGAPSTIGNFAPTSWKKRRNTWDDGDTPGLTGTFSESRLG
jgi:hypothetical protein